jgi:uncharacterized protein YegP (UPF0339 family)
MVTVKVMGSTVSSQSTTGAQHTRFERRDASTIAGHVYQDEASDYSWHLKADNGEIIPDSAEGYRHKRYAISMAEKLNPGAELVVNEKSEG